MNFSLRQLRAFLAVASHRSFTKASEEMHVTQAGLSSMVRELEGQAGVALFERTTRVVALTDAGRMLLPAASRAVRDLEMAMAEVGSTAAVARKKLKIAVAPMMASSLMPQVLRQYHDISPDIAVELVDIDRDQIQALVASGTVDAGFGIFFNRVSGIRREALFPCTLTLLTPGSASPSESRTLPWSKLPAGPLVTLPSQNPIQELVDRRMADAALHPREMLTVRNLATVFAMVEANFGIAIVPSFCASAARRYNVHMTGLSTPPTHLDYYCITRAGRKPPDGLEAFAHVLAEAATEAQATLLPTGGRQRK